MDEHEDIKQRLDRIEKKIDDIKAEEDEVLALEKQDLEQDEVLRHQEEEQLDEIKKLQEIEKEIQQDVKNHPLQKITYRDVTKGLIGAFFGIVGHFAFSKGVSLAADISMVRAHALMISSFIIVTIFLYFAGFRQIDDKMLFNVLPIRAIVIYVTALTTVLIVLALYGAITLQTPLVDIYKTVATISVLAVMGAGTADLIGGVEE